MNKYLKEYEWANIRAMLKNNKKDPLLCDMPFTGKWVIITGATSGIGYETAREYASHGANLLTINRNEEKSKQLCTDLQTEFGVTCEYLLADFSRLEDVHKVAKILQNRSHSIDVLIHNAGVHSTGKFFTEDDLELVFQINYLASFILNYTLKEKLMSQPTARILYVNSEGHRFALAGIHLDDLRWDHHHYSGLRSYGAAKTAQLLSLFKFSELFANTGVTLNAVHPGDVKSNMGENNGRLYRFFKHVFVNRSLRSPTLSAQALYYLGVSPDVEGITGKFFNLTTEEVPAPHALDRDVAEELWVKSLELGGFQ